MRAMRRLQVISQFALKLCFGAEFNCDYGLVISSNQGIEKNILFIMSNMLVSASTVHGFCPDISILVNTVVKTK